MSILDRTVLFNSLWMIAEKIITIFGVIFVTAFVAKYIGPENFGKITFAASVFGIVQTIAMFGLENILFQKISKNRKLGEKLIKATHIVRNILYLTLAPLVLLWIYFNSDFVTFIFSVASCISVFFALNDVYGIYFNAILKSKINAILNTIGLSIAFLIRYLIAFFELNFFWLVIPIILTTFLPFILKYLYYHKIKQTNFIDYKKYLKIYRNNMLFSGKKLVLYSLSVAIFTQTSQLILGWKSKYDLGIYMVTFTLGNGFYFIFVALISSVMVKIYAEPSQEKSEKMLFELQFFLIIISIFFGIFFRIFGYNIIEFLYGVEYLKSVEIINTMVIVCGLSGISTVSEKYLLKFSAYNYLKIKTSILVLINVPLTYILIEKFSLNGAVYSILITCALSTTIFNYFHKQSRIFFIQCSLFKMKNYIELFNKLKG